MKSLKLKEYLIQIADSVDEKTTLEDIYNHLSLLNDIDESEEQEKNGETFTHDEVKKMSDEWLK